MVMTKYGEMTKQEAIKAIISDYGMTEKAMEEIFREGFLRGEDYQREMYRATKKEETNFDDEDIDE